MRGTCDADEPRRGFLRCEERIVFSTDGSRRISWRGVGEAAASRASWKSSMLRAQGTHHRGDSERAAGQGEAR